MLEVTESAADVLRRSYEAAARFNPEAKIRISVRGEVIDTEFAESPHESDEIQDFDGITIYVAPEVGDGVLDTSEEHDRLIVRTIEHRKPKPDGEIQPPQ